MVISSILILGQDEDPGWFTQAIINFIYWFIDWLCDLVLPWVEWILDYIPADWLQTFDEFFSSFSGFIGAVNAWVALDWAFALVAGWILFVVTMITVKLIVKLFIPTVG